MPRQQLNVRVPETTIRQLQELTDTGYESQAHVVIIAVDRLYQQERRKMAQAGYKLRWVSETGGDWLHDGEVYADLDLAKLTAQMAFEDEYVDPDDIIQVYAFDGEDTGDLVAEYDKQDFE